jgi:outer membrane lipoprotein-sorting protein
MTLAFAAMLQLQAATSPATQPATATDSALERAIEEIDQKASAIEDLKATFHQSKHTALLKKPMQSTGTVRISADPDHGVMRWDTTGSNLMTTWISATELRIYSPRQSLLEVYPIESGWSQLTASPLPRLKSLREQFDIRPWDWEGAEPSRADQQIAFRLMPKHEQIREHVREVRILIDREIGCVLAAEVLYPDEDRLTLRFTDIRINSGIEEDELKLEVPPGTTISRPLEAEQPAK